MCAEYILISEKTKLRDAYHMVLGIGHSRKGRKLQEQKEDPWLPGPELERKRLANRGMREPSRGLIEVSCILLVAVVTEIYEFVKIHRSRQPRG